MTGTGPLSQDRELRFYELLASEAPVRQYEELVQQARRDGVDQTTLERLGTAKRLALEVHDLFGRRCQRGAELAALVDTARDLAGSPGLEPALRLIVRRARLLLTMDVAFISLVDDTDNGSYVASAVGAATTLANGFPLLEKKGGLVVSVIDRVPLSWSADYLADERIEHHSDTDELIRAEGLHAVLSVPLSCNGRHIGDLHVGHRQVRHFAPDEVALLRSLADLAATAIDRTRFLDGLWAESKRAQQDAFRARAELSAVRETSGVQSDLVQLVLDGAELGELLARWV
jgi:GAF domain-containing protein